MPGPGGPSRRPVRCRSAAASRCACQKPVTGTCQLCRPTRCTPEIAALDDLGRVAPTLAHRARHMPLAVIVEDDVQVRAGRPRGVGQPVGHSRRQLAAVQIGDQFIAAVAVKARAAVGTDVEPDPGPPAGSAGGRQLAGLRRATGNHPVAQADWTPLRLSGHALQPGRRKRDRSNRRRPHRRSGTASRRGRPKVRSPRASRHASTNRGRR